MLQLVRLFKTFGCWCLLSSIVLLACENNGRQNQVQPVENQATRDASSLEPEDVTVEVSAGADTTIRSNALLNDFIPQWTVEEVLKRIPEAEVSKREPVPNRHVEGQIDTLVTIKSDSTIFQFYSQPGNDMLQSATLNKGGIALGKGLEIGMLAEEVARLLPPLQHKKSIPQSILIRSEQTPSSLRLRFEKNRLAYINYDGYVD